MLLPGIGVEGQQRIAAGHAFIVGCGALGCMSSELLARAGVGTLTIVDRDVVELTNLQRQVLFDEDDVASGLPKAEAARRKLAKINAGVKVHAVVADFTHRVAEKILLDPSRPRPSLIIDGTDNLETRYLLNDLSVKHCLPYLYAGAVGASGMSTTFTPPTGACLRCVFDELPAPGTVATCDTAGVLGPAVSIVASCQAADAIKILAGLGEKVSPTLLDFDLWSNRRRRIDLSASRREDCVCCGTRRFEFLEGLHASRAVKLCGQNAVQIAPAGRDERKIDLPALQRRLEPLSTSPVLANGFLIRAKVGEGQGYELTVFEDGRAVVKGTESPELARSVYARYVGA